MVLTTDTWLSDPWNPMADPTDKLDVLAVGAHPDDLEITCGGTLAKLVKLGYRVGMVDLTSGEADAAGDAGDSLKGGGGGPGYVLCVPVRVNLNLPNRVTRWMRPEHRFILATAFRKLRPGVVIVVAGRTPAASPDHHQARFAGRGGSVLFAADQVGREVRRHRAVPSAALGLQPLSVRRRTAELSRHVRRGHQRHLRAEAGSSALLRFAVRRRPVRQGEALPDRDQHFLRWPLRLQATARCSPCRDRFIGTDDLFKLVHGGKEFTCAGAIAGTGPFADGVSNWRSHFAVR